MQRIFKGLLIGLSMLSTYSCTKTDNQPGPNAGFQGRLLDVTNGKNNFPTETGGVQVKLEELSWSETPTPQYIPSKPDGTFEDTKLFSGHYRVTPTNGAFWPVDPVELDINGLTTHDFELTPYLKITNFSHSLSGDTLIMTFKLAAPITDGLPAIIDTQPFVNITPYVGAGATISQYTNPPDQSKPNKIEINSSWNDGIAQTTYVMKVPDLKHGRTFYARVGVRVNDSYKQFNYSDVVEVQVP